MNEGRVEQLGSPRAIYEHPATRFVAGFIGTSNLLSGDIKYLSGNHAVILSGDGQHIEVPLWRRLSAGGGSHLELTVRPEKIDIKLDAADCGVCRLRGTVTEVVYLGTSTSYNVLTSTGAEVTVFVQNINNADDVAARGQQVWLSWDPEHSYAIGAE
jgi:spermidine/putrescine transport system ATP-binding protein